jgi:hypothetical protein
VSGQDIVGTWVADGNAACKISFTAGGLARFSNIPGYVFEGEGSSKKYISSTYRWRLERGPNSEQADAGITLYNHYKEDIGKNLYVVRKGTALTLYFPYGDPDDNKSVVFTKASR